MRIGFMSIKLKLLIQTLIPILCVTLLGAAAAIWITVTEHKNLARKDLVENLGQMRTDLDRMAGSLVKSIDAIIQDSEFVSTARSLHLLGTGDATLMRNLQCQVMQQLQKSLQTTGGDVVALYGTKGHIGHATLSQYSISSIDPESGTQILLTPTADAFFVDCSAKKWRQSAILAPVTDSIVIPGESEARFVNYRNELFIEGVAPIKLVSFSMQTFAEEEQTIGALMFRRKIPPEFVEAFAKKISRDVYVFRTSGELILGSGPLALEQQADRVRRAVSEPVLSEVSLNGEDCYLMLEPYRYGNDTVAIIASKMSRAVVVQEIKRIIFLQLGALIVGLMLASAIALGTGRIITRPIATISRQMKEIAQTRDLDRRVSVTSKDEIGELSASFNDMVSQLKDAYSAIETYKQHLEELVDQRTAELRDSLEKLEAANGRVVESIHYARTIQQAILPSTASIASHLPDHFVIWNPKDVIGGDIFWFDGRDRGFLFAVIDCTGHGVPGAIMTMISCTTLNRVVHEVGCTDPAKILGQLNRLVRNTLSRDPAQPLSDDGFDIGVCYVDASRTSLTYAGARISLFYTRNGSVHEVRGDRHSLGYMSSNPNYEFTNHRIEIDSSLCFYMTTDGIQDQVGGVTYVPFGRSRFTDFLATHHSKPFSEQRELLLQAFREYKGDGVQRDDVTVVGFAVQPDEENRTP